MSKYKVGDLVKGKEGSFEEDCFPDEFVVVEITAVYSGNEYEARIISDELEREGYEPGEEIEFYEEGTELTSLGDSLSMGTILPMSISSIYNSDHKRSLILLGEI